MPGLHRTVHISCVLLKFMLLNYIDAVLTTAGVLGEGLPLGCGEFFWLFFFGQIHRIILLVTGALFLLRTGNNAVTLIVSMLLWGRQVRALECMS